MCRQSEHSALGLYFRDTRFLSRLELKHRRPSAGAAVVDGRARLPGDHGVHQSRAARPGRRQRYRRPASICGARASSPTGCTSCCGCATIGNESVELALDLYFDADFADLFEVRGTRRARRGTLLAPKWEGRTLTLAYLGVDEVLRKTRDHLRGGAGERAAGSRALSPGAGAARAALAALRHPGGGAGRARAGGGDFNTRLGGRAPRLRALDVRVDRHLHRQRAVQRRAAPRAERPAHARGAAPTYGNAAAGRRAVVRGAFRPRHDPRRHRDPDARPALRGGDRARSHALQGKVDNVYREEEPGKIMHELRRGELANLKAHPPHAVLRRRRHHAALPAAALRGRHVERRPRVLRAAARAHRGGAAPGSTSYGDLDGDGFVEYRRRSRGGLANQGWRDASDAVRARRRQHRPRGPSRWPRCRAYVYHAKRRLATLYGQLGDVELSERLQARGAGRSSGASTSASGWRTSSSWPWRWTATSSR